MLWVKTFHVLFVVSWLAGIFYVPRILVNVVEAQRAGENTKRLGDMAYRLFRFSTILATLALAFGLWLWLGYGIDGAWLHWKLVFVAALIAYHVVCGIGVARAQAGRLQATSKALRVFNEAGVLIVLAILIFVIVKPVY